MMWPKYREMDWRPIIDTCAGCGKPIHGQLGKWDGQDYFLLENGASIHDNVFCTMTYMREHYLIKG